MVRFLLTVLVIASAWVSAGEHGHHETHLHEAHEHGKLTISLAIDGDQGLLEMVSPAVNLMGFEGEVTSKEQESLAVNVFSWIKDINNLLQFSGGECKTLAFESNQDEFKMHKKEHKHDHHKHDKEHNHQEHNHAHKDPKEDEHKDHGHHDHKEHGHHEEHHDHKDHSGHTDVRVEYQLACVNADKINGVKVLLADKYSGVEEIELTWLVSSKTGIAKLTKNNSSVSW